MKYPSVIGRGRSVGVSGWGDAAVAASMGIIGEADFVDGSVTHNLSTSHRPSYTRHGVDRKEEWLLTV